MSGALYLDSSALVKLVIEEPGTRGVRELAAAYEHPVSSLIARVEVRRAVTRAGEPIDPFERALERMTLIPLDLTIADRAAAVGPRNLRTLDAIHLATALEFAPDLDGFVTYDERLAEAARAAGLPVVSPR